MSKARRLTVALLVAAAFIVAPAAQAENTIQNPYESTPTTLYFHIFDTVNRFVINTQAMDSSVFEVGGANFPTTPDFGTEVPGSGLPTEEGWDMNTIYGYSTAGPVEYGFIENGRPRFHPERGIAATVDIDDTATNANCAEAGYEGAACVIMYLDPRDASGQNEAPTISPEMRLRITLQEGDDPGLDAKLDEGRDIMVGTASFHMANFNQASGATSSQTEDPVTGKPILYPDDDGMVEVVVPLTIEQNQIPKKEAYNVRVDWFQRAPDEAPPGTAASEDDQFTTGWLRLGIDPDHLPRLEMNIMNPVYFSFIHPQVAANTLLIHAGGNSPWGTYDINLAEVTIEMTHVESGKKVPQNQLKKILSSNEHVHGLHDEDAQMTYLWDYRDNNAEIGEYEIHMTVTNDAGNSMASGVAGFIVTETEAIGVDTEGEYVEPTVDSTQEVDTPSAGILPALALLGAALVAARKRWGQ